MNVLEKILEEKEIEVIKELIEENERCCNKCEGACSSIKNGICNCYDGVLVQAIQKMQDFLESKKHENNDWIPCSKRLPEVPEGIEDDYCPEFNVTIKGADKATTMKYAPDGTWFDDSGEVYNVIAWKPLPEPYRAADKPDWKENMLNTFLAGH